MGDRQGGTLNLRGVYHRRAIVAVVSLAAFASGGCGMMLMNYASPALPPQAVRLVRHAPSAGRIAVVSVAAAGERGLLGGVRVDSARSREAAEWFGRVVRDSLATHDVAVLRHADPEVRGYFDPVTGFDAISISPYREASYFGRRHLPSFYCVDDSLLRAPAVRSAWIDVLGSLRHVEGRRPRLTSLPRAPELRAATGADAMLIVVTRASHVSTMTQVVQGVGFAVLTLGFGAPYHERSSTLVNVYLVSLKDGEVLWADACLVDGIDPTAWASAWDRLLARW